MMHNTITERVNRFLEQEYLEVGELSILRNEDGSYDLFNQYRITKKEQNIYEVSRIYGDQIYLVSSLKNAVTWCIYEKRNKWAISNRILEIDKKIAGIDVSMALHKRMIESSKDNDNKLVLLNKLNEEKIKKKSMLQELTEYINRSKLLQARTFEIRLNDNKKINTL